MVEESIKNTDILNHSVNNVYCTSADTSSGGQIHQQHHTYGASWRRIRTHNHSINSLFIGKCNHYTRGVSYKENLLH